MSRLILFSSFLVFILSCSRVKQNALNSDEHEINENLCGYNNPTKSLGIGILEWNPDTNCQVSILDQDKQKLITTIDYCLSSETSICPYFFKPDYGIVHFVVLEEQESFYKIIYNYDKIGLVSKREPFNYKTWKKYLLDLPLGAKLKSDTLKFKVLDVKADSLLKDDYKWIKWKDKDSLLIEFSFLM